MSPAWCRAEREFRRIKSLFRWITVRVLQNAKIATFTDAASAPWRSSFTGRSNVILNVEFARCADSGAPGRIVTLTKFVEYI